MKIRPVGAELFSCGRTEGQTDMTKLIVAFRVSANSPKSSIGLLFLYRQKKQMGLLKNKD